MSDWFYKKISWFAGCVAIAFLFGLVVYAANIEIKDIDLWLHLAVGKHIVQNLSIPKVDFLSCTIANTPWINHEWLFQTVIYYIHNSFGIEGLIGLKVAIVLLTFVLLLFLGYTREHQLAPIAVLLLVLLIFQYRMTLRPDMLSLLFFALYISIVGLHLQKRWSLWLIVFIQLIWVNTHGFFIFGPAILLITLIGEWVKRHWRLPYQWNDIGRLSDSEYKLLRQALMITILACLVNPYLLQGAIYPIKVLFTLGGDSAIFFKHIHELQRPIHWNTLFSWHPYHPYKLLIICSFGSFLFNRKKVDISVAILWFVFLLFSLSALRNIVFFAMAAYFAILANLQYMTAPKSLPTQWSNPKLQAIGSTACKIILIVWMMNYGSHLLLRGYYDFDRFERKNEYGGVSLRNFPHQAADFLVSNQIQGNFFNDFNSGAYLLGRASPNIKVFIDGRTELYGGEFYSRHQKIWKGDAKLFQEASDQYQLTGAFLNSVYVPAPKNFLRLLSDYKDWVLVYFDYDATIFLKDIDYNRRWIDEYRIDMSQWQTQKADLLSIGTHNVQPYRYVNRAFALYSMGFLQKALNEATEALRIEPYNVKAHRLQGKIFNERKEYAAAFESLRKAKLIEPGDMHLRYEIALALYHLGESEKAKEQCIRVLTAKPKYNDALFLLSRIYVKQQRYKQAVETAIKVNKKTSDTADEFTKIGNELNDLGMSDLAQALYDKASEADPDSATEAQN